MGRMHLIGGEKGGVGKSVVAKLLTQLFIDQGTRWIGFDTDRPRSTFARCYGENVHPIEIDRLVQIDLAVEALEDGVEEVVVDLTSRTEKPLWRWIDTGQVIEFIGKRGHTLWFWQVLDGSRDSVWRTESLLERLNGRARVVCIMNHGRARDFAPFDESNLRHHVEQIGGAILHVPGLDPESMATIETHDKSFWAAIHNDDPNQGPCLTLMQRQRTRVFVEGVHASFGSLLERSV